MDYMELYMRAMEGDKAAALQFGREALRKEDFQRLGEVCERLMNREDRTFLASAAHPDPWKATYRLYKTKLFPKPSLKQLDKFVSGEKALILVDYPENILQKIQEYFKEIGLNVKEINGHANAEKIVWWGESE